MQLVRGHIHAEGILVDSWPREMQTHEGGVRLPYKRPGPDTERSCLFSLASLVSLHSPWSAAIDHSGWLVGTDVSAKFEPLMVPSLFRKICGFVNLVDRRYQRLSDPQP